MADSLDLSGLVPVPLADVLAAAAATTRVDRKYVVPLDVAQRVIDDLAETMTVLEIRGRRWTSYRSTYFDTDELLTCRAHVQQRRRRWKARSRLYEEDGFCRIEVKLRDGSGQTVKHFHPVPADAYGTLTESGRRFLRDELQAGGFGDVGAVVPTLEVTYRRATLADLGAGTRVTLDAEVRAERAGQIVRLDDQRVVVETKGHALPGPADRSLLRLGFRPRSFSKYAAGITLIDDRIADNDVRRMLGTDLHLEPAPSSHPLQESA